MRPKQVLILCTGNSCRSQMAEALVNHFLGDSWQATSAGTEPSGYVHPLALEALEELAVPTAGLRSKSMEEFRDSAPDLVVTVCDDAADNCPVWLGEGRRMHVGFSDPAQVAGSDVEKLAAFRHVRDDIFTQLLCLLTSDELIA